MRRIIKVCGLRYEENISEIAALSPDLMGFIFYECSPRFAGGMSSESLSDIGKGTRKIGVFMNPSLDYVMENARKFRLDTIQLHGDEEPDFCREITRGYRVIKAFGISGLPDMEKTADYEGICEYFLFDSKSPGRGGTGKGFNWEILEHYRGSTPFLLSGRIGPGDEIRIGKLSHPLLRGVDINSRFETAPGLKDMEKIKEFILQMKKQDYEQDR